MEGVQDDRCFPNKFEDYKGESILTEDGKVCLNNKEDRFQAILYHIHVPKTFVNTVI